MNISCTSCGRVLARTEQEPIETALGKLAGGGVHIVGDWTAHDDVTIVCLVCQATADEEQFDTWMGTGAAVQRLYDAGAVAALRRRFRIAVAHQLDAAGVDLVSMTEDERFAAVSDAQHRLSEHRSPTSANVQGEPKQVLAPRSAPLGSRSFS